MNNVGKNAWPYSVGKLKRVGYFNDVGIDSLKTRVSCSLSSELFLKVARNSFQHL